MLSSRTLWFPLALVLSLAVRVAAAEEEIPLRITDTAGEPFKVALQIFQADMSSSGALDEFMAEVKTGLEYNSGFVTVDPNAFLEPRATENFSKVAITCENWRGIGANILVQGLLEKPGEKYRAQYRVWDIDRCSQQGDTGIVEGGGSEAWYAARRVADDVVLRFTGKRGIATTQMAFVSDQTGKKEIYIMESDGTRRRQITRNSQTNLFPDWSADAMELGYTTYRRGIADLRVLGRGNSPGGALVTKLSADLTKADKIRAVFGPDPGWVTMVATQDGNTDLFLVRRDGGSSKRLTEEKSIDVSPTWSPDRKRLAFASDRSGTQQIYVMDKDGGPARRLTYRGNYNATPAWSPTGEWIAYAARTGSNLDIYLIDPDSGYTVPLIVHERTDESPSWSPDGRKIAFMSDRRGRREVYTIDIDGRNLRRVTQDFGNCSSPAWARWID
jgi:TolB protein